MKKKKIFINQQEEIIFRAVIILNTKVMVIQTEYWDWKNVFIKLDHT